MKQHRPRKGEVLHVTVGPWADDGMARCAGGEGWELRLPGAVPGEQASVRIDHVSAGAPVAWAQIESLASASADRRAPPCRHHGPCGACPIQHVDDDAQLSLKIASQLERLPPLLKAALAPREVWIPSPRSFAYRHKAVWLPQIERGRLLLGGRARRSAEVVDLPHCEVLAPALRSLHGSLSACFKTPVVEQGLPLRSLVGRANRRGQVLLTLVLHRQVDLASLRPLARELAGRSKAVCGVHVQFHSEPGNAVTGRGPTHRLLGKDHIGERTGPLQLHLAPLAFSQVNPDVLEGVAQAVLELMKGHDRWHSEEPFDLLELHCGGGVLGLFAAKARAGLRLKGIDSNAAAIETARSNALRNKLSDTHFLAADATALGLDGIDSPPDAVLVDPPRAGLGTSLVESLLHHKPELLVYVSCSGDSLASDAAALCEGGYRLIQLRPADMMPQTPHVEWIAAFDRP